MATLSVSILKHQQKDNGSYPVNISLSHKSKTVYIDTGYYAQKHQVQIKKGKRCSLEIKDKYLLIEVLNLLSSYNKELSKMVDLDNYTSQQIKEHLEFRFNAEKKKDSETLLDFIAFARERIKKMKQQGRSKSAADYNSLLNSLEDYLRRDYMYASEFTKKFSLVFLNTYNLREPSHEKTCLAY